MYHISKIGFITDVTQATNHGGLGIHTNSISTVNSLKIPSLDAGVSISATPPHGTRQQTFNNK